MHGAVAAQQIFTPSALSGLQIWYDASDLSTITDAGAGAVSQWNDKSGNGRNASQGTGTSRPLTGTTSQNGRNTLKFDGGDFLVGPSASVMAFLHNTQSTCFAVGKRTTSSEMALFATGDLGNSNNGRQGYFLGRESGNDQIRCIATQTTRAGNVIINNASGFYLWGASAWNIVSFKSDPANATANLRSYGKKNNGTSFNNNAGTMVTDGSNASGAFSIGRVAVVGARYWIGEIAEIIIYNRQLTDPEIAQVESYLNAKWAVF